MIGAPRAGTPRVGVPHIGKPDGSVGGGGVVTPLSFSGLAFWHNYSSVDNVTIDTGGISAGLDFSGQSRPVSQSTEANRPAHVTGVSGINGLGAVSFAGSPDALLIDNATTMMTSMTSFTLGMVVRAVDWQTGGFRLFTANGAGVVRFLGASLITTGRVRGQSRRLDAEPGLSTVDLTAAVLQNDTNHLIFIGVDWNNRLEFVDIDGTVLEETASWGAGNSDATEANVAPRFGTSGAAQYTGLLGEDFGWSRYLTITERTALRNDYVKPLWATQ